MPKIMQDVNEEIGFVYEPPQYSDKQLEEFQKEIEPYMIEKRGVRYLDSVGQHKFFQDQGALSKNGAVLVTGYGYKKNKIGENYPVCDYPSKYEILSEKLNQWLDKKRRKEYGQKMETKRLEQVEINMQIPKDYVQSEEN